MNVEEKSILVAEIAGNIIANNAHVKSLDLGIQDGPEIFSQSVDLAVKIAREILEKSLGKQ